MIVQLVLQRVKKRNHPPLSRIRLILTKMKKNHQISKVKNQKKKIVQVSKSLNGQEKILVKNEMNLKENIAIDRKI